MAYNPTYKKERKRYRFTSMFPILLFFIIVIGASFYAGTLWERMQAEQRGGAAGSVTSESSQGSAIPSSGSAASNTETSPASASESSSQTVPSESESIPETAFVPLVDRQPYVEMTYFDDAVFVGDSVSSGLSYYGLFPEEQVLADTSVTMESVLYRTPYTDTAGNYVTSYDAIVDRAPAKLYIMLGANGIEWLTAERMIGMYETFLTNLKDLLPDTVIYVQSVLPVTAALDTNPDRDLTNAKIDAFNESVYALCERLEVHYLNVTEVFKDDSGYLPDEASPLDGLHFTTKYYRVWLEYLRNHALPVEGAEAVSSTESEAIEG